MTFLIKDVELEGSRVDVAVDAGLISEIGATSVTGSGRTASRAQTVLDGRGCTILPGLHDHHLHLRASAARGASVDLCEVTDLSSLKRTLRHARATGAQGLGAWIRAIGYHQATAGPIDRYALDAAVPDRPVRVQQHTGEAWVLNSMALHAVGIDDIPARDETLPDGVACDDNGRPTGWLWRLDKWLGARVPGVELDLDALSMNAARLGITGFTDATADRSEQDARDLVASIRDASVRQRLHLMCPIDVTPPRHERVTRGPVKIMLDDVDPPSVQTLSATCANAHAVGRSVAIHCVTLSQLAIATAALGQAAAVGSKRSRPADRIEHGAVIPPAYYPELRSLNVIVVTQPAFIAARGAEYLRDVPPSEQPWLYPAASMLEAGVVMAAGSDAPYGPLDPWLGIATATERRTRAGTQLGPGERVGAASALAWYLGHADAPETQRRVAVGAPADLVVVAGTMNDLLHDPAAERVQATVIAGELAWRRS